MTEREEIKYACDVADEAELSKLASSKSKYVRMVVAVRSCDEDAL